jgi:hypothetical protein
MLKVAAQQHARTASPCARGRQGLVEERLTARLLPQESLRALLLHRSTSSMNCCASGGERRTPATA